MNSFYFEIPCKKCPTAILCINNQYIIFSDSDGLLSFKHLSEDEKFSLEAVKFLCHYCLFGKTNDSDIGNGIDSSKKTQKDDIKRVKRKLFGLLGDEAEWDVNKTFDIHLVSY